MQKQTVPITDQVTNWCPILSIWGAGIPNPIFWKDHLYLTKEPVGLYYWTSRRTLLLHTCEALSPVCCFGALVRDGQSGHQLTRLYAVWTLLGKTRRLLHCRMLWKFSFKKACSASPQLRQWTFWRLLDDRNNKIAKNWPVKWPTVAIDVSILITWTELQCLVKFKITRSWLPWVLIFSHHYTAEEPT